MKYYTVTSKNLFALVGTLLYMRVPFEFKPHKVYNDRKKPNEYFKSVIVLALEENGKTTLADILWALDNKWESTFEFEILKEE